MKSSYDCIVIGGGPGGSTVATILADQGLSVAVLERAKFPRHHVGESLIPETYATLKRIGMLEKLKASPFPKKESVEFVTENGKSTGPYYFTDRDPHERSRTWQVRRDVFDQMMLENAKEHGAEVYHGINVLSVLFEEGRATGVRAADNGNRMDISAKVVVDATGLSAILARQLKIRRPDPNLRKGVMYSYYRGATRGEGRDEGSTIVYRTEMGNGWFWFIPLPDNVVSIGLVADLHELFTGHGDDPTDTFHAEIERCEALKSRLNGASMLTNVFVTMDFSYSADKVAGDGWVLVGDAYGFLDPVYSSGVMLALKSGELAGDCIAEGIKAGDVSEASLSRFGPEFCAGMQRMRQLVYTFYDPQFSFGGFLKKYSDQKDNLVRILIGDVFTEEVDSLFDALAEWSENSKES